MKRSLFDRALELARRDPARSLAFVIAWAGLLAMVVTVMKPWLSDWSTFGFHDWDVETSHRYLAVLSLGRYHELPGWNPYACGGFPAWGYVEADTNVVSPFLPAYLLLPMAKALRVEVLGMALLGAAGAYAAASRFTRSHAARALPAALWAVDGRWALQAAAGHTWHLAYAFLPWAFYFFERAREAAAPGVEPRAGRVRDHALGGAAIAMLVYAGGIYPLPHTVLCLGLYAIVVAALERSARSLTTLAIMGGLGVAFSAPKLFPLLDGFKKAPRLIESTETMDVGALWSMLTAHDQGFGARPARVTPYGWHEWGIYVGLAGVAVMALAVVFVPGKREAALRATGLAFLVLGFGAFHPESPWSLLHRYAPVFKSQHVPSRFLYTAVLVLGLLAAAGLGRLLDKRSSLLDCVAALAVGALALDIATVAQKPMTASMWMVPPDNIPQDRAFHFEQEPPFWYKRRDWAGPMYLAMLGNTGVINCYGTPPFERKGARPVNAPDYRGEAYLTDAAGTSTAGSLGDAKVVDWSPNHAVLEADAKAPGLLVYNMNFDDGWHTDVGPAVAFKNALAVGVPAGKARVTFTYRAPYLWPGVLAAVLAGGAVWAFARRERRAREEGA